MKRRAFLLAALPGPVLPAVPPGFPTPGDPPKRLPDGRLQSEAILKADYERNLRELERVETLLKEVLKELRKTQPGKAAREVFRALEEVERLSKRVHGRMRRF